MAGFDKEKLEARRRERARSVEDKELVTRVVAWGTVWDAEGEKLPGEEAKVPKSDAAQLEAAGTLVTAEKWKALQEVEEARKRLAELEGKPHKPQGPPVPPPPDVPSAPRPRAPAPEASASSPEAAPSEHPEHPEPRHADGDESLPPELQPYSGKRKR